MKVLFISSGNTAFDIIPFVKSQEISINNNGVETNHFLIKEGGLRGYLASIFSLSKHLKKNHYNLIHAHYAFAGWVAVLSLTRIPIVVSYMGSDVYGLVNQDGKRKVKSYFEILSAKVLQPFVKHIIVKSRNLSRYIFQKNKSTIIPNGVDFNQFNPMDQKIAKQRLGLPIDKKFICFLGNPNDPRKNFKLLNNSTSFLPMDKVDLLSPYPCEVANIPLYINAASVLVLCSFLEGSPNVIKEAMACNCPIVSTDVGDVRELIDETEGCYISSFEPNDLANKILLALNFNKRTTGREKIKHLEINNVALNIIKLYKAIVK